MDEPCYGFNQENHVAGEHLWITWDGDALSASRAGEYVDAADTTWESLRDDLGWLEPPGPVVASVSPVISGGITVTVACEGEEVPRITIDADLVENDVTLIHELGHAFQYPYFEGSSDSLTAWAWWMEASATWVQGTFRPRSPDHKIVMDAWRSSQTVTLHQPVTALAGDESLHMYGSTWLAYTLDHEAGGPDAVLATWQCGSAHKGERIWFPDLIAEMGGDFEAIWLRTLAHAAVGDLPTVGPVGPWLRAAGEPGAIKELPASGDAEVEALGWTSVAISDDAIKAGKAVKATITPADDAPWLAAIAVERGGVVAAVHRGEADGDGIVVQVTPEAGDRLFLLATPTGDDEAVHPVAWSIESEPAGEDRPEVGPLDPLYCGDPPAEDPDGAGCGCQAASTGWAWLAGVGLITLRRRRSTPVRPA